MRITLFISILGLLHACNKSPGIYTRLFKITESEKFAVVNIDSFNTLSELETYICVENGKPIFPFDFEKKRFDKTVKTGIELLFDMSYCGHHVHFSSQVIFEMDSLENWNYEGKLLRKERLLELVKMNFLNNGYNPKFSESPQKTVFTIIAIREEKLERLESILSDLADAYVTFITQQCESEMDLLKCKKAYPLNIFISYKQNILLEPIVNEEEIMEDINLKLDQ